MCGQVAFAIPKIFSILPPGVVMELSALNNFELAITLKTANIKKRLT